MSHRDDRLGVRALSCLRELGAQTQLVHGFSVPDNTRVRAFFTNPPGGMFPSKHVRKLRLPHDVEHRGFVIPIWIPDASELYALREVADPNPTRLRNFDQAIRCLYYCDEATGTWKGPKRKRERRLGRSSDSRSEYAL